MSGSGHEIAAASEDQYTISAWGEETFGPATHPEALVDRARLEFDELREAVLAGDAREIAHEIADILILLYRVGTIAGCDINQAVAEKMAINRARRWIKKGDGTGRHVKEEPA
jgi:NTP pyrophosphatase (non-canonical NTP hydrolase)